MHNKPIYAALLLAETVLAFAVGVFGNKVAQLLSISAALIVGGAVVVILLLYLLTLARLQYEAGDRLVPELSSHGLKALVLNTVMTVFPVGIVVGILFTALSTLLLPGRPLVPSFVVNIMLFDYEVVAFMVGALLLVLLARRSPNRLLVITFAFGYAFSSAATVLVLQPYFNSATRTFLCTALSMGLVAVVVSSRPFIRVIHSFEQAISPSWRSTKE